MQLAIEALDTMVLLLANLITRCAVMLVGSGSW